MAPRGQKAEKPGPDGAPPGAESRSPADKHAYDADGRAAAREGAPITIGGTVFHRIRKNWKVTREMRTLLRTQERSASKTARLQARVDALTEQIRGVRDGEGAWKQTPITDEAEIDRIEQEVDGFNDEVDKVSDEADEAAYALIALLLRGDGDGPPEVDHLKESLDVEEAGELAAVLAGGAEPDPTPEPTSS